MDWDAIGAIGEIVGAAAVFGSLFYVGRQISQNVLAVKGQTFQSLVQSLVQLNLAFRPEDLKLMEKVTKDQDLSESEHLQYTMLFHPILRNIESAHYQHRLGLIDHEQLLSLTSTSFVLFGTEEGRRAWMETRDKRPRDFREFIEATLKEIAE